MVAPRSEGLFLGRKPMRPIRLLCRAVLLLVVLSAGSMASSQIVLGQIGPFTGPLAADAAALNQGIKGQKLTLFEADDRFSGEGFAEQFPKAMEKKPLALISPMGSAAIKRML